MQYKSLAVALALGMGFPVWNGCALARPAGLVRQYAAYEAAAPSVIVDKPIVWNARRKELTEQYARAHYGRAFSTITPRAVVIHWTADDRASSAWNWFNREASPKGTAQVASHFLVDRDGAIYRLTPETRLNPHAIGYNWCAIGIENVGGKEGRADLTEAQLFANVWLVRHLHRNFPTIRTVFGHYQQDEARSTGLYREQVQGYHSVKHDPGPGFMQGLEELLKGSGVVVLKP